jgi:hypothetical protein
MSNDVRNGQQAWLEQDGIQVTCKTRASSPVYEPFWEIVRPGHGEFGNPYDMKNFQDASGRNVTVRPGDDITVEVLDGSYQKVRQFGFQVVVDSHHGDPAVNVKSAFLPPTAYTGRTAEVITEHSSGPSRLQGDLAWLLLHELGVTKPPAIPAGLVRMGDVRYSEAMYLTHLPGDVKPEGVPVAQSRVVLADSLATSPVHYQQVFIYPGRAYPTIPGSSVKDGFTTHYYIP